jgi:hypothetical protein
MHTAYVRFLCNYVFFQYARCRSVGCCETCCVCTCFCGWLGGWVGACACLLVYVCMYVWTYAHALVSLKHVASANPHRDLLNIRCELYGAKELGLRAYRPIRCIHSCIVNIVRAWLGPCCSSKNTRRLWKDYYPSSPPWEFDHYYLVL